MSASGRARREAIRMLAAERLTPGDKTADIAADLRIGIRQVEKWHSTFNHGGIKALRSKGPHTVSRTSAGR
ncbi:helix-turn-helix domain-containing protein [Nocardia sp. NPDC088792]|uniref:helix-turn-helix domain-containing protein n=1 Tax=Nocardia sp. NPDC088792 TaxID=3364332 RepID=UPI0037FA6AE9